MLFELASHLAQHVDVDLDLEYVYSSRLLPFEDFRPTLLAAGASLDPERRADHAGQATALRRFLTDPKVIARAAERIELTRQLVVDYAGQHQLADPGTGLVDAGGNSAWTRFRPSVSWVNWDGVTSVQRCDPLGTRPPPLCVLGPTCEQSFILPAPQTGRKSNRGHWATPPLYRPGAV